MPGRKQHEPDIRFAGNKITPDEVDMRVRYTVQNPSVSASFLGTVETAAAAGAPYVMDQVKCDYPRNVLVTITGEAAGMGGTATITGTNQFGVAQTETIGFASAANGGTAAGTKIFDTVTAGTVDGIDGDSGTAVGTASLGFAIGTATGIVNLFGLPVKIQAVSDIKRVIWNDNTVTTGVNGGTVSSTYIGVDNNTFTHGQIVAAADAVYVDILTTYNSENDKNVG